VTTEPLIYEDIRDSNILTSHAIKRGRIHLQPNQKFYWSTQKKLDYLESLAVLLPVQHWIVQEDLRGHWHVLYGFEQYKAIEDLFTGWIQKTEKFQSHVESTYIDVKVIRPSTPAWYVQEVLRRYLDA